MTKRPIIIGITGSIGVGKTTTADMFREEGVPVWDADEAVHRIYNKGGAAVPGIQALYPAAVVDGAVDRRVLSDWIQKDANALPQIEAVVHPLIAADRTRFLDTTQARFLGLDIPLLYEIGADALTDVVVVMTIGATEQRRRVLERPAMTEDKFKAILARQLPDAEKQKRADFVIETLSMDIARNAVRDILEQLRDRYADA